MKKTNRVVSFLLALTLVTGLMPADAFTFTAFATGQDGKPADGTLTDGEVFPTDVSKNFRIPGIVNFKGDLVASADARWDNEKDGGGMDLVVSTSTDGGDTWSYTFAGYLGDNGNVYNANSSTLMDPLIITDGNTLYLLADMYPAGYSISSSSTTNTFSDTNIGFNSDGKLLLSDDNRSSYDYYLDGDTIRATDGTAVSGYTVDGWFNLYDSNGYVTNLFFADSPYQVRATSYICMMSSADGKTWSEPTLLNVKPSGVAWMVLGPGSGLVTQDGYIAFTAYDGSNIYLIYGKDGVWNTVRTSAATNESSIIELNDGTIRAFVKRGGNNTIAYVDFTKNASDYTAGSLVDTGETNFSQCMVSSLHYSRTLGGKEVVLVCCPAKPDSGDWNGRFNGKIFVFTLDENNAMTLEGSHALNGETEFFAYSNMAEMDDGTLAVLYEGDCISYSAGNYTGSASHIIFTTVNLETALGISFDDTRTLTDWDTNVTVTAPDLSRMEIEKLASSEPAPGFSHSMTYSIKLYNSKGQLYSGSATVELPVTEGLENCERYIGSVDGEYFEVAAPVNGCFTVTVPHFSDVTISGYSTGEEVTFDVTLYKGYSKTVTLNGWAYSDTDVVKKDGFDAVATMAVSNNITAATKKLVEVTDATLTDGQYLIYNTRAQKLLTNESYTSNAADWLGTLTGLKVDGDLDVSSTELWTITKDSNGGYTVSQLAGTGEKQYITFSDKAAEMTETVTSLTLKYTNAYNDGCWLISYNNYYLSDVAGAKLEGAFGWYEAEHGANDSGHWWAIYKIESTTGTADTDITFNGVEVGTTTATVGHVTFNIEVLDPSSATAGDIENFTAIVGTKTYDGNDGNVVELAGKEINALTINPGASFQLDVDLSNADAVAWSVPNEAAAIVTVDSNGEITAVAEGEAEVTATVYKDGVYETVTIPIHVTGSFGDGTDTTTICYYIETLAHVSAWYTLYSTNLTLELQKVVQGQVVFFERPVGVSVGMIWMSAPEGGYALTYMAATGTEGKYYPLHSGNYTLNTGSGYYADTTHTDGNPYYNLYTSYGAKKETIDAMLGKALTEHKADGAMSMGRKVNDGSPTLGSSLSFAAESLPAVSKSLSGVLPVREEGDEKVVLAADFRRYTGATMTAEVGDYVYFTITVTQEAPAVFKEENGEKKGLLIYSKAVDENDDEIETLVDKLDGAYFYSKDLDTNKNGVLDEAGITTSAEKNILSDLGAAWTEDQIAAGSRSYEYFVVYQVQKDDLSHSTTGSDPITNEVTLTYKYTSTYSSATATGGTTEYADILVVYKYMGEYVVDFGLPIVIKDTNNEYGLDEVTNKTTVGQYGTTVISEDNTTATYTPTSPLLTAEEVLLYRVDGEGNVLINAFTVVPATTVYYEDTFITPGGWTSDNENAAGLTQDADILGDLDDSKVPIKAYPYGYDPVYNTVGPSNGTQLVGAAITKQLTEDEAETYDWPTATFSFTGTGVEIYAKCSSKTGAVMVEIWKADANGDPASLVWAYLVDTQVGVGMSNATSSQSGEFYNLPIVSVTDLPHDTYRVKLIKVPDPDPIGNRYPQTNDPNVSAVQGEVYIDGFRVFGTVVEAAGESSLYYFDQEDHPDFYELRDFVLHKLDVQNLDDWNSWYSRILGNQVFNDEDVTNSADAIIIDSSPYTEGNRTDLLLNGPKNELFLASGQSLVFKVTTNRLMQIGLKAPQGETSCSIKVEDESGNEIYAKDENDENIKSRTIISSVDMFYSLGNTKVSGENAAAVEYTVTITNNGSNILSITKLKICDDPNASFEALTEEDVANVLIDQGILPQRTYGDATVNVSLVDYAGNQVGSVTLSKHGAVGRRVTFTAEEILCAARQQMPESYTFVNEEAVFDVTGTCGESRTAYVQVGKVATVHITYISLTERKVCTITVTKIQFAAGDCKISATELMHYSLLGRMILLLGGISAQYGAETSVVVPVL